MLRTWMIRNQTRLASLVAVSAWAAPLTALAAISTPVGKPGGVPGRFKDINVAITSIFNIVITVAGVAFVVLFLIGGIQYLSSAGNEDTTKKARQLMLDAVIGLGIVVGAWAIGTYVLYLLGIGTGEGIDTTPETN